MYRLLKVYCKIDLCLGFPTRLPTFFFFLHFSSVVIILKRVHILWFFVAHGRSNENLHKVGPIFVCDVVCVTCVSDILILFFFE